MSRAFLFLCAAMILLAAGGSRAEIINNPSKDGALTINRAWANPNSESSAGTAKSDDAKTLDIYLSIQNTGTMADQITMAATSIARKAGFMGINTMNQVVPMGAIDLPPKHVTSLYPGGPCIRLSNLQGVPATGQRFTLHLEFSNAKPIDIPVFVVGADDDSASPASDSDDASDPGDARTGDENGDD